MKLKNRNAALWQAWRTLTLSAIGFSLLCVAKAFAEIDVPQNQSGYCENCFGWVDVYSMVIPLATGLIAFVVQLATHHFAVQKGVRQSPPNTSFWFLWGNAIIFSSLVWVIGMAVSHSPWLLCENYRNGVGWAVNYRTWVILSLVLTHLFLIVTLISHPFRRNAS